MLKLVPKLYDKATSIKKKRLLHFAFDVCSLAVITMSSLINGASALNVRIELGDAVNSRSVNTNSPWTAIFYVSPSIIELLSTDCMMSADELSDSIT